MAELKLYENFLEAEFLERPHRFKMKLLLKGKVVEAYVPNTGRLAEFLWPGRKFFLTRQEMPKYDYKVIGTEYQGNYVLIDTIKTNRIFQEILQQQVLPEFRSYTELKREVTRGGSKFDFLLNFPDKQEKIIEIKTCTLCHNGVALFPDAPTERGQRHLKHLNQEVDANTESWSIYLITNYSAEKFIPNYHIDFAYARIFQLSNKLNFKALKLGFSDPVTMKPELTSEVPILFKRIEQDCRNAGTYLLIMKNDRYFRKEIGALGEREFKPGYYLYVGSALQNLEQRVKRHRSIRKKIHWHIDRIVPEPMRLVKTHLIRRKERLETEIARKMGEISEGMISGFGASDDANRSHLFYFSEHPHEYNKLSDLILDFQTYDL
jgi:sugar fermentation stimulation protein A